jgi:hypothetical protein
MGDRLNSEIMLTQEWWEEYLGKKFIKRERGLKEVGFWKDHNLVNEALFYSCGDFMVCFVRGLKGSTSRFTNPILNIVYLPDSADYIAMSFFFEVSKADIVFRLFDGLINPRLLPLCMGNDNDLSIDEFISLYLERVSQ